MKSLTGALLSLLLLAGCKKNDIEGKPDGGPGEEITVTFSIAVPAVPEIDNTPATGNASTKAGTDVSGGGRIFTEIAQDYLAAVDVLVFDRNNAFVDHKQGANIVQTDNLATFNVTLRASRSSGDTYRIMVLANSRARINGLFGTANLGGHRNETYDQICTLINEGNDMLWDPTTLAMKQPMWGEFEDFVMVSGQAAYPAICMIRALVKMRVGTNPDGIQYVDNDPLKGPRFEELSNFKFNELCLYKPNTRYAIAPARPKYDFADNSVTGTTIPLAPATSGSYFRWVTSGAGNTTESGEVFIPETDVDLENGTGKYRDDKHFDRAAIVVGGYYDESSTLSYYRLDFRDMGAADPARLHNLLRNHFYVMVITQVKGPGYPTPDEAYYADDSQIEATLVDWKEAKARVVFDGQYFMRLDRDKIIVGKDGSACVVEVHVRTNHPNGPWFGMLIDCATNDSPSPSWVSGYYTVIDNNTHLLRSYASIQPNATGQPRKLAEQFFAGNMRYRFYIEQSADPWITVTSANLYPMDGAIQKLDVTSICNWICRVKPGTNDAGKLAGLLTVSGNKNTRTVYFRVADTPYLPDFTTYNVVLVFEDPTGVNPAREITVSIRQNDPGYLPDRNMPGGECPDKSSVTPLL